MGAAEIIQLVLALGPTAIKLGAAAEAAIAQALANHAGVSKDEIVAIFNLIRPFVVLPDFEKEAGVTVEPDGSVKPQT